MLLRLEAVDLPGLDCGPGPGSPGGWHNIHVAVQRRTPRDDLLGLTPGDAPSATWTIDVEPVLPDGGADLRGPCIHGRPGARFVYLTWGTVDDGRFEMFRRAKVWLDSIPPAVLDRALVDGTLTGRLGLTDRRGHPLCAGVRPPLIDWGAG